MNQRFGRVLIFIYGLFALSAGARAGVQLATNYSEAPLAYLLSALAAVVYLVATVCLAKGTETARRVAIACVAFELVGVIAGQRGDLQTAVADHEKALAAATELWGHDNPRLLGAEVQLATTLARSGAWARAHASF